MKLRVTATPTISQLLNLKTNGISFIITEAFQHTVAVFTVRFV